MIKIVVWEQNQKEHFQMVSFDFFTLKNKFINQKFEMFKGFIDKVVVVFQGLVLTWYEKEAIINWISITKHNLQIWQFLLLSTQLFIAIVK